MMAGWFSMEASLAYIAEAVSRAEQGRPWRLWFSTDVVKVSFIA